MCYDFSMKEEIIDISKNIGIDIIGFCNTKNLIVPYDKYKLQDELGYKSTFQVGNISDKDLSNEKYNIYNTAIVIGVSYKKVSMDDKSKIHLVESSIPLSFIAPKGHTFLHNPQFIHLLSIILLLEIEAFVNNTPI